MDTNFILIGISILILLCFIVFLLLINLRKARFVATDGTTFESQSDLAIYQDLFLKTKPLFSSEEGSSSDQTILGYDKIFLTNLKTDGFKDLKTLIKYRNQFKSLSSLINP